MLRTISPHRAGSGRCTSLPSAAWAARIRSDGTSRSAAAVPGTPSSAAMNSVTRRGGRGRQRVMRRSALQHRAPEKACGARHREQRADADGAGRLARDRHGARVAAEGRDVVAYPLQGRHLVEEAEVRRCVGQEREPLDAEPVVDRDRDDAVAGEGGAVGHRYGAGAVDERPTVDPDEHRQAPRVRVRGPHAQVEVLVARDRRIRQQPGERSAGSPASAPSGRARQPRGCRSTLAPVPAPGSGGRPPERRRKGSRGRRRRRRSAGLARRQTWWRR